MTEPFMDELSETYEKILQNTSKEGARPAILALEDGTVLRGFSCGAPGEVEGEICFNTGLVGYLEVVSDPSYAGQIVCMTYPQIGNYGVNEDDAQATNVALRGLVVRDMCTTPSNWRSTGSLSEFLRERGVVAIEGIDTRALVRHIRERGAMRAVLSTVDLDAESLVVKARAAMPLGAANFVETVSRAKRETYRYDAPHTFARSAAPEARWRVVAYDCGVKSAILDGLVEAGCAVEVVPWNTPAEDVLALAPDGVFLSNGPGDPERVEATFSQVEKLLGRVPIFGICLGHQMLGKAAGAAVEKLKYGHRGINQPVMNLITKRVEITVQNHGYNLVFPSLGTLESSAGMSRGMTSAVASTGSNGVAGTSATAEPSDAAGASATAGTNTSASTGSSDAASSSAQATPTGSEARDLRIWTHAPELPIVMNERFGRIQLTHVNLNDGTIEGMRFLDVPAFSVQYHPEAAPGSTDSHYLFRAFTRLMETWAAREDARSDADAKTRSDADKNARSDVDAKTRSDAEADTKTRSGADTKTRSDVGADTKADVSSNPPEQRRKPARASANDYLAIDIAADRLAGWKFGTATASAMSTADSPAETSASPAETPTTSKEALHA